MIHITKMFFSYIPHMIHIFLGNCNRHLFSRSVLINLLNEWNCYAWSLLSDCRNAGYFNSLIKTPGLRLRRSVEHSFKEEREDVLQENLRSHSGSGLSSDGLFYANISRKANKDYLFDDDQPGELSIDIKEEEMRISSEMKALLKIGRENNRLAKSQQRYGFDSDSSYPSGVTDREQANEESYHGAVYKRSSLPSDFPDLEPEEPVSTFNRGLVG